MQFKVDENLHSDAALLLRQHGHDARTVQEQRSRGGPDSAIAHVCQQEERAILTLDLDFSDNRTYPPGEYFGIIVLRPRTQARPAVLSMIRQIFHFWIRSRSRGISGLCKGIVYGFARDSVHHKHVKIGHNPVSPWQGRARRTIGGVPL